MTKTMPPGTRVEVGVVGVPPTEADLRRRDLPETVVLNFSKLCNLWCSHCLYPDVTRRREEEEARTGRRPAHLVLPFDTLKAVADEMAAWEAPAVMRIAADGEPLINPRAIPMIAYAKERGLTVSLTTNGIQLTEEMIGQLLATGIDVIDVSIDAATAETFGLVRPGRGHVNFYPVVEKNVRRLIEARNALGPPARTRVMVNLIDQPDAHSDVPEFARKWTEFGADAVLIRPFHSTSAQTLQEGVVTPGGSVARFPCRYPFTRLNVGFDEEGHPVVYYCSHDWTEKTVVGVLGRDGDLRGIWDGPAMEEIRRRHRTNEFPPGSFCASCPDWYLGWGKTHHGLVNELKRSDE